MSLALVGLSHRDASLRLLEDLSLRAADLPDRLIDAEIVEGAILLSTCNRVEVYIDSSAPEVAIEGVRRRLFEGITAHSVDPLVHVGDEVAQHLFSVASGLESMVVGEAEIAGQVRRSAEEARHSGASTAKLDRLFRAAAEVSRTVATRTGLGSAGRSVVSVALDLIEERRGPLAGRTACLVGTGSFARVAHAALERRGIGNILLYSLHGRAERFAETHNGTVIAQADLAVALEAADVVVTCSGAPHPVLDVASVRAVMERRSDRPLSLLDLALTRDIESEVRGLSDVDLIDLDDVARHAPSEHLEVVRQARHLVDRAVAEHRAVEEGRLADPAIVALRGHIETIMARELERATAGADERTAVAVEESLRRFTRELLHLPTVRTRHLVREGRGADLTEALGLVFGVGFLEDADDASGEDRGSDGPADGARG